MALSDETARSQELVAKHDIPPRSVYVQGTCCPNMDKSAIAKKRKRETDSKRKRNWLLLQKEVCRRLIAEALPD
jgi:hypothetical protein